MFDRIIDQLHSLPSTAKGRAFESLAAWYLTNAPGYRHLLRRVYTWNEWPGRWGADAGIDLVAVTNAGDAWAVQAKAYAPDYWIKKRDIDSFLSESNRSAFSFRLLIGTTDHIGPTAARTMHEQEKPVGLKLLSQLRHDAVAWPDSLERLKPQAPARLDPRPHQLEAVNAVVDGFRHTDRGQLLMACGTGKTLTGLWIDQAISSKRTLVVVPSLSLLGQTLRAWTAQAAEPFEYQAVCSDETVAASDSFTSWTSDLGVPVTTAPKDIRSFLVEDERHRVVFSTYHSCPVVADAQANGAPWFDLAIVDEAHRAAGHADSAFGTVLDASRIRAHRRLFMTATPRFVASHIRAAAREKDLEVTSMDDPELFGEPLHRLSFRDAIERDLLSDYRVVVIGVDDPDVGVSVERRELVAIGRNHVTNAEALAQQVGLLRAVASFGLTRVLTFHSRKASARDFAKSLQDVLDWMPSEARPSGRLWAHHITGDMNAGEREILLDQLRALEDAEWGVLSNVKCVAEGVDVPTLDGIVFIDPRRSEIDVIQAVGRAIRKSAEKKLGIVVIPVLIPRNADDEEILDSSDFRKVWAVVRALRAHDDVLAEQLDTARFELGRRGGWTELPSKIILDLPGDVSPSFARALSARIVQRSTTSFEFWFGLLTRYVEEHGSADALGGRTIIDGYKLGSWVIGQRKRYEQGCIDPETVTRLESIEGWNWRVKPHHPWEVWYGLLAHYGDQNGTVATLPPEAVIDGYKLGEWASAQRARYARGLLSTKRASRLEALPGWFWQPHNIKWERMFALLEKYIEREGNSAVPYMHYEDGLWLGKWVANQRASYRGARPQRISADRIARLEALKGWTWERRSAKWEHSFQALLAFAEREKHTTVPEGHVEGDVNLYPWVVRQRQAHRDGTLQRQGQDRIARLEALPGWHWTETFTTRWDRAFRAVAKFAEREGHTDIPPKHIEDGVRVGAWIRYLRFRHAEGKLQAHPDRIKRIEALPGWSWQEEARLVTDSS